MAKRLSAETAGNDEGEEDEDDEHVSNLPKELRTFKPLGVKKQIRAIGTECKKHEDKFVEKLLKSPQTAAPAALRASLTMLAGALRKEVNERAETENVIKACDDTIAKGAEYFIGVYDSIWNKILVGAPELPVNFQGPHGRLELCVKNAEKTEKHAGHRTKQTLPVTASEATSTTDMVIALQRQAAVTWPLFKEVVEKIEKNERGWLGGRLVSLKVAPIKGLSRILEKVLLWRQNPLHDPSDKDLAENAEWVLDCVRAMFVCKTPAGFVKLLDNIASNQELVVLRVKDRINNPSYGWRDVLINCYIKKDGAKHVCEIQVALNDMCTSREVLDGHGVYGRVRNAWELLGWIGVGGSDYPKERQQGIRKLINGGRMQKLAEYGLPAVELVGALAEEGAKAKEAVAMVLERESKDLAWLISSCEVGGDHRHNLLKALAAAGYTISQIRKAGATVPGLLDAGWTEADLETSGVDKTEIEYAKMAKKSKQERGEAGGKGVIYVDQRVLSYIQGMNNDMAAAKRDMQATNERLKQAQKDLEENNGSKEALEKVEKIEAQLKEQKEAHEEAVATKLKEVEDAEAARVEAMQKAEEEHESEIAQIRLDYENMLNDPNYLVQRLNAMTGGGGATMQQGGRAGRSGFMGRMRRFFGGD